VVDRDLAEFYGVETRALKQAVKRNIKKFPSDFMFVLEEDEFNSLRSQNATTLKIRNILIRRLILSWNRFLVCGHIIL